MCALFQAFDRDSSDALARLSERHGASSKMRFWCGTGVRRGSGIGREAACFFCFRFFFVCFSYFFLLGPLCEIGALQNRLKGTVSVRHGRFSPFPPHTHTESRKGHLTHVLSGRILEAGLFSQPRVHESTWKAHSSLLDSAPTR